MKAAFSVAAMTVTLALAGADGGPAARGESLAAFDGRCIPVGCVAPPSNTAGILSRRALPAGRLARLGATPAFHHGLLAAQAPRPSQHGSVTQQVAKTIITVDYNRPVARGRMLFGALVPWGRVWCPGADNCTTIELSTDVQVNGHALAAGTYSIWAEPQADRWTMIFNKAHPVFHTRYPADQDALRVQATPRQGSPMETLAFYFPVVDGNHAELVLHWGTVVVPLAIDVP